jgi:hypothetical protein
MVSHLVAHFIASILSSVSRSVDAGGVPDASADQTVAGIDLSIGRSKLGSLQKTMRKLSFIEQDETHLVVEVEPILNDQRLLLDPIMDQTDRSLAAQQVHMEADSNDIDAFKT